MKILTPNEHLSSRDRKLVNFGTIIFVILIWSVFNSTFLPKPMEVLNAAVDLIRTKHLVDHFFISIIMCFKGIAVATIISVVIAYIARIPLFKSLSYYLTKFRFLPTVGISFLFMKLSVAFHGGVEQQKIMLLVFGISAFLVDSIYSVVTNTPEDEINYARTLRLNQWQALWEVIIVGKLSQVFECIRQNFAIAWMMLATVENLCKSQGGIGVILADLNKWFKFEYVYAVQIYILLTGVLLDIVLTQMKYFLFPYTALNLKK